MKCKRSDCSRPVERHDQVYCSASCAPYGNFASTPSQSAKGPPRKHLPKTKASVLVDMRFIERPRSKTIKYAGLIGKILSVKNVNPNWMATVRFEGDSVIELMVELDGDCVSAIREDVQ